MVYKVVSGGVVVEFSRRKSEADEAFKLGGRGSEMWKVGINGYAVLLEKKP